MKKFIKKLFIFTILLACVFNINMSCLSANAANADSVDSATSITYAIDIRGHGFVRTQDAYLPDKALIGTGLKNPVDLFIDEEDMIYIVDQTSRLIAILDSTRRQIVSTIEYEGFVSPRGIYILNNNKMYIADSGAGKVFVFLRNEEGNFTYMKEYGRPTSVLFAGNEFKPMKISVDPAENMYIIGESVTEGIIQLSKDGEFMGYFATNKVTKTFKEKLEDLVYDDETLELLNRPQPPQFTNLFTDKNGLLYSTTSYSAKRNYEYVKKHNTAGQNIIGFVPSGSSPTDIYVGANDIIYVSMANGYIYLYNGDGDCLFCFGGSSTSDISGLFTSLVALAVDSQNNIWCLDDKKAAIHKFSPTEYTKTIYEAFDLYYKRNYEASIEKWNQVLHLNQMSALAHKQLGLNYLYSQNYKQAMVHLKLAEDRQNYSQAFWELRNIWLQENLVGVVLSVLLLFVVIFVYGKIKKAKGELVTTRVFNKFKNLKFVQDCTFNMTILRHPYDNFYYLKTNKKGSTLSCIILMFAIFFIFLWFTLGKGFIYQYIQPSDIDIVSLICGFFGIIFLITFCNWLVSSIQDGEGTFLAIYRMVIVSLIPWAISMICVTLLSYVASLNEVFILQLIEYVGIALSVLLFILGVQNVHFYTAKKTIISLLLTILLMAIIVLVLLLIIILANELWQFIEILLKEGFR